MRLLQSTPGRLRIVDQLERHGRFPTRQSMPNRSDEHEVAWWRTAYLALFLDTGGDTPQVIWNGAGDFGSGIKGGLNFRERECAEGGRRL